MEKILPSNRLPSCSHVSHRSRHSTAITPPSRLFIFVTRNTGYLPNIPLLPSIPSRLLTNASSTRRDNSNCQHRWRRQPERQSRLLRHLHSNGRRQLPLQRKLDRTGRSRHSRSRPIESDLGSKYIQDGNRIPISHHRCHCPGFSHLSSPGHLPRLAYDGGPRWLRARSQAVPIKSSITSRSRDDIRCVSLRAGQRHVAAHSRRSSKHHRPRSRKRECQERCGYYCHGVRMDIVWSASRRDTRPAGHDTEYLITGPPNRRGLKESLRNLKLRRQGFFS